jgi:Fe-S-cluster containining protein
LNNGLVESLTLKNFDHNLTNESKMTDRYKVVQDGDRWRCLRCGTCCLADFEDKWLDHIGALHDRIDTTEKCVHLRFEDNKYSCIIYENRPNACKAFPFTLRKQDNGNYKLVIHKKCKGYGHGRIINIRLKILQCLRYSNLEFQKRMRFDFRTFDEENSVALIK